MADILSDNIEYPQTRTCACPRVEETVTTNYTDILEDFDAPCLVRSLVERCQVLVTRCREMERQLSPRFTHTLEIQLAKVVEERDTLKAEKSTARHTADYWKAEHLAGNEEIDRLKAEAFQHQARWGALRAWLRDIEPGGKPSDEFTEGGDTMMRAVLERMRTLEAARERGSE